LDDRVRLAYLEDVRRPGVRAPSKARMLRARDNPRRDTTDRELDRQPSELLAYTAPISALTDRALRQRLSELGPGVLITNRPFLHQAGARWAPEHTALLAAEHSTFEQRNDEILAIFRDNATRFDAVVVLTDDDRDAYERLLEGAARVVVIPNAVPDRGTDVSTLDGNVVVAAGALVPRKAFDRLIDAFAPLVPTHPDWQLHIYGKGGERGKLQEQVERGGLSGHVVLKGFDPAYQKSLRHASAFALTSHFESFGMVIVEAMAAGVPVVAFDCPSGPRHLIRDGHDGLLIPNDDVPAFTEGLRRLMDDEAFRVRAAAEAVGSAAKYRIEAVVSRWEELFGEVEAPVG
jgi:glycosyltransferase involved in cell wall biosynthesis